MKYLVVGLLVMLSSDVILAHDLVKVKDLVIIENVEKYVLEHELLNDYGIDVNDFRLIYPEFAANPNKFIHNNLILFSTGQVCYEKLVVILWFGSIVEQVPAVGYLAGTGGYPLRVFLIDKSAKQVESSVVDRGIVVLDIVGWEKNETIGCPNLIVLIHGSQFGRAGDHPGNALLIFNGNEYEQDDILLSDTAEGV